MFCRVQWYIFTDVSEERRAGLTNLWYARPKWHAALTVVLIFIYFAQPPPVFCQEYVDTHTNLSAYRLYMNYDSYQLIVQ